jgi:hypothetical protein
MFLDTYKEYISTNDNANMLDACENTLRVNHFSSLSTQKSGL